ncbi:MAG: hypothetical protein ACOZBL_03595 [Patescibacteria group bacterium]
MIKIKNKQLDKNKKYAARKNKVNTVMKLNQENPRLIINKSNKFNYAQIV